VLYLIVRRSKQHCNFAEEIACFDLRMRPPSHHSRISAQASEVEGVKWRCIAQWAAFTSYNKATLGVMILVAAPITVPSVVDPSGKYRHVERFSS
jgi:hypothetical protein